MRIFRICIFFINIIVLLNCIKHSPFVIQSVQVNIYRASSEIYELRTNLLNFPVDINSMIYCFKQFSIFQNQDQGSCKLQSSSGYKCIQTFYQNTNETLVIKQNWSSFSFSLNGGINNIIKKASNTAQVQIDVASRKIIFKNKFLQDFKVYHLITALSITDLGKFNKDIQQYKDKIKVSYLHTYSHDFFTDSLIVQRYYQCHLKDDFIYLIFQGAVFRDNVDHLFTGILSINKNKNKFHMWGGYSYSPSHAARDMVGYESHNSKFYDLFSLIAAAPFQDVAPNIKGNKNIVRIANSANSSIIDNVQFPYHFIQFYRQFDTNDTNGDQIIRKKIYNRFCFASYEEPYDPKKVYSLSVLNNSFIHNSIFCHEPSIAVSEDRLSKSFFLILIFIIMNFIL